MLYLDLEFVWYHTEISAHAIVTNCLLICVELQKQACAAEVVS